MKGPIETKVAGGGAVGAAVTIVLLLNGWQHWFTPPPADVTAALTASLGTLAGFLLPHTSRNVKTPLVLTAGEADSIKKMLASVQVVPGVPRASDLVGQFADPHLTGTDAGPVVQPPATGTGSTTP